MSELDGHDYFSVCQALEAGKVLHIKEHEVLDGSGKAVTMCAPVECKGIVGSDDRYVVLYLMTPMLLVANVPCCLQYCPVLASFEPKCYCRSSLRSTL